MYHLTHEPVAAKLQAYLFVALLLPLRNQLGVCVTVLQQPLVKLPTDGLLLVVHFVYVAATLMVDLEDRPLRLMLGDVCGRGILGVLHLDIEDLEVVANVVEARWWLPLPGAMGADGRHCV